MLSVFPELLFLAPLSALLIRASLAALFAIGTYKHARVRSMTGYFLAILELVVALSLALGYYAQLGALLGLIIAFVWIIMRSVRPYSTSTVFLAIVMCLSVLVTGAGAFAFDLPL